MNTFFTSDPHYFHKNISGSKVSSWKSGYRNFDDQYEMSKELVKVINQTVKYDDILYCLGDWSFAGIENIWNFRKQLECQTIHLILGNHDNHIRNNKILPNVDGNSEFRAKDAFTSVHESLILNDMGGYTFYLNHYPTVDWYEKKKGSIMLHGHCHGNYNKENINIRRLDVGLDSAKLILGEFRPFTLNEIINLMKDIELPKKDHHS